jgi:hypothetical protein
MIKNRIWLIFGSMAIAVLLAGCQSSRFMQDDMYFNQTDAIREVREFENTRLLARLNKNQQEDSYQEDADIIEANEDYYDYSYTSRLRRFNSDDNTWGYYDPYYTNYYWYNNSKTGYFGNSLYSTYTWWGPNFSSNYTSHYWGEDNGITSTKSWINPWESTRNGWRTPYNRYAFNGWNNARVNNSNLWNTGLGFTNMYFNSFDNNCYSWYSKPTHNFSALMRRNGIQKDVTQRPQINYTAIRENKLAAISNNPDSTSRSVETNTGSNNIEENKSNTIVNNDNENSTRSNTTNSSIKTNSTTNTNTNTTTKRWDNNADLNITPNSNKSEDNTSRTSRSGIYSEGSRNNNYVYKGSAIPNKGSTNNGGTQNKGKDPNK